jgi:hypothetical protein
LISDGNYDCEWKCKPTVMVVTPCHVRERVL